MYSAFLQKTQRSIEGLKKHLRTSDVLRTGVYDGSFACKGEIPCFDRALLSLDAVPARVEWRVIDHCAAVTRLYAIYEQFAHEMVREHLNLLQGHLVFQELPNEVKKAYRRGLAEIMIKKDGPRYRALSLPDIISQYDLALSGAGYVLEPAAMLIHEQNLRLPELSRLFSDIGVSDLTAWLEKHRAVKAFFDRGGRVAASAEHEMETLISYRNDAAHGSIDVDDIPGLDFLFEFFEFVSSICEALSERVQLVGLECMIATGHAKRRGEVAECFRDDHILISELTGDFAVGQTIYLIAPNYCVVRQIVSLQLNDVDHPSVSLTEPTELGIAVDRPGRKKADIVSIEVVGATGGAVQSESIGA